MRLMESLISTQRTYVQPNGIQNVSIEPGILTGTRSMSTIKQRERYTCQDKRYTLEVICKAKLFLSCWLF
jgi:hypothetical protein